MTKKEFLSALKKRLSELPKEDRDKSLEYYNEILNDRIEDGMTEEEAVSQIGSVDEIARQTVAENPFADTACVSKPKKKFRIWEIILIAIGSPIWLSLIVAAFALVLSLYVVLWSVIVCVWAAFVSLFACALVGTVQGIIFIATNNRLSGFALFGAAAICAGLAILMFFGSKAATKGILFLTKKIASNIKKCFSKKEEA